MRVVLEFSESEEDKRLFELTRQARGMLSVLLALSESLRDECVYGRLSESALCEADKIRAALHELLKEHNVRLDL